MKQTMICLVLSLSLLLVGCTVTQPATPTPTATEPATAISATLAAAREGMFKTWPRMSRNHSGNRPQTHEMN